MQASSQATDSDFELAVAGNRDCFGRLIKANQAMVFSIAWNYLRDRGAAEEIAQDVFLDLYVRLKDLESASHVTNWLRTVTARRCIDHGRRAVNRMSVPLGNQEYRSGIPTPTDPFLKSTVARLLSSLPGKQRMVVVLRYQEDMDPQEIAESLQLPLNTVKSTLHRALAVLREKLERLQVGL